MEGIYARFEETAIGLEPMDIERRAQAIVSYQVLEMHVSRKGLISVSRFKASILQ